MKLVIAGASGFVGTEVLRQALSNNGFTSVVALSRRKTNVPQNLALGADLSKFKSIECDNFSEYPESVKRELVDADCCIWLLAVTPARSKSLPSQEVRKICHDFPMTALETFLESSRSKTAPFRFIYASGAKAERDPNKKPWILGDYCLMRGEVESMVLRYAAKSEGRIDAYIVKPGIIGTDDQNTIVKAVKSICFGAIGVPTIGVDGVAAALLRIGLRGFENDTLSNEVLDRIGNEALNKS